MEEQKPSLMKNALNWGLIIAIVLIIFNLLIYFLGFYLDKWPGWIGFIILTGGIIFATKSFRDNSLNGTISYGRALGFSVLVVLFSTIITSVYSYIFLKYIDTDIIPQMLLNEEEKLINSGLSDSQIEKAAEAMKKFITPLTSALMAIPVTVFLGFIISLITSIFLKKDNKEIPFAE